MVSRTIFGVAVFKSYCFLSSVPVLFFAVRFGVLVLWFLSWCFWWFPGSPARVWWALGLRPLGGVRAHPFLFTVFRVWTLGVYLWCVIKWLCRVDSNVLLLFGVRRGNFFLFFLILQAFVYFGNNAYI